MPDEPVVLYEERDSLAIITLNRPEKMNTLNDSVIQGIADGIDAATASAAVSAVVLRGAGRTFTAGYDLNPGPGSQPSPRRYGAPEVEHRPGAWDPVRDYQFMGNNMKRFMKLWECPKPVIAAVHGYCIGGGVDLIAACDIRLASADAIFSVREAKVAIVADLGSLQRLPSIIGAGHLAELAFTGKDISAERAKAIGLVNDVAADAEGVLKAAYELAQEIATNSPIAVQGTKAVLAANEGRTVAEGLDYVATWNAGMLASDDLIEAMTAFMERRTPKFTGR